MTVPTKHIKTLTRRQDYLKKVKEDNEANSYDLAEISALRAGVRSMQESNQFEALMGISLEAFLKNLEDEAGIIND